MTVVDLLVVALGLAGALLLDPWIQKRIAGSRTIPALEPAYPRLALARARLAEAADLDEELAMLRTGLASALGRWEDHVESGHLSLAEDEARTMRRIKRRIARLQR